MKRIRKKRRPERLRGTSFRSRSLPGSSPFTTFKLAPLTQIGELDCDRRHTTPRTPTAHSCDELRFSSREKSAEQEYAVVRESDDARSALRGLKPGANGRGARGRPRRRHGA